MFNPPALQQNHLLRTLSDGVLTRLRPHLQYVPLSVGQVLYERENTMSYAYFPTDAIVSLLYEMENGASAQISVVGNEGVVGYALFLDSGRATHRAVVQCAGHAFRVDGRRLKEEFNRHGEMFKVLLLHTQSLLTQMAQTAACNRHHTVDQQLCRWLLLALDRLPDNHINMTHGLIADMLGVRREGVTDAARKLQKQGVIDYARGHITVLDRPRLERRCCECYGVVRDENERLLPHTAVRAVPTKIQRVVRAAPLFASTQTG